MQGLPQIGDVLDDTYKIESLLGTGGFGAVYLARQLSMDREVALKILVANAMNVDEMIQRFRREVMACRNLGHPNTIRIYDFRDRPDGILYYTMEYVKGPTLKDIIKNDGPLPPARVSHILKQICKSLAEAHSHGIVHRDLKPANIMLAEIAGETDFVKVVDFGIAKIVDDGEDRDQLTNAGVLVGTLNYMSPEQIQGGEIGPVSDLYALGLIAIEMLMGRSVFEGTGRWEVLHKQISDEPVDIPQEVIDSVIGPVLQKALQKQSTARYAHAEEMLRALGGLKSLSENPLIEVSEVHVEPEPEERVASGSLPMPEPVPVEDEPPLPEAVRQPQRTKSLDETTGAEEDAPANKSADSFSEEPTSLRDSGVSPNPLHTPAATQVPDRQPMVSPIGQSADRQPQMSPMPGQNAFVPSGDTDPGPAGSSNKGLMIGAGVLGVLILIAGVAVSQLSGDPEPPVVPEEPPVVAVVEPEVPEVPEVLNEPVPTAEPLEVDPAVPTKTIRLLTPNVKAQVFEGDELVGATPLRFPVSAKKTFTLRAEGYDDQEIELSGNSDEIVDIRMTRTGGAQAANTPTKTKTKSDPTPTKDPVKRPKDTKKPPKDSNDWVDIKKKPKKTPDVPVF